MLWRCLAATARATVPSAWSIRRRSCVIPIMDVYFSNNGCRGGLAMATLNRLAAGVAWERPADLSNKEVLREFTPSALRAFFQIRELWELRYEDPPALLRLISNGPSYPLKVKTPDPPHQ